MVQEKPSMGDKIKRKLSLPKMVGLEDENKVRGNWSGRLDFFLSCIGYAVGLGNIWRFPYICYRNGGGAFLIPYCIFLLLCGMPLVFLEIAYGQFCSQSPTGVWKLSPMFKGIGWGMVIVSGIVCIYYNIIITWTLYYLLMSFQAVLPWSHCNNDWNDENCALWHKRSPNATNHTHQGPLDPLLDGAGVVRLMGNLTANSSASYWMHYGVDGTNSTNVTIQRESPSEQYWQNHVLELSEGIENIGPIRWQLLLCLIFAWVMIFLCLCKGVKSSGKVVYVTATFPYLVLIILLVRGVTLPGSMEGIKYYLIPKWEKLLSFKVWAEAAGQIFYSVGAAWGAMITFASYNRFQNNCLRDAIIVPLLNEGTSIFAGFVIFSIIGFMAQETGRTVDAVITQGPGLAFVVYPGALAKLPISPMWAVLFFLMLLTVGVDSQFGMFETMTSAFVDEYPHFLRKRKTLFIAATCFVQFLLGIVIVTKGGIYILQIMDWYSSTYSLMVFSFMECIVVAYVYGVDRFYEDIELMIGRKPPILYKYSWLFVTPAVILFIFVATFFQHESVTYGDYHYPAWAIVLGWLLALCSILPIPGIMILKIVREKGPILQRIKKLCRPAVDWGPVPTKFREQYYESLSPARRQWLREFHPEMKFTVNQLEDEGIMMKPLKPNDSLHDKPASVPHEEKALIQGQQECNNV
ncbi:sodium- and chloride-dependent glycine transporter 1 isoform X2 [Lingula anatina]|uniref:Transporter n=1 Tax=Lingula anatina TaxID=7574 RepID=A0A1S3HFM9_LINAN|nr:sodium- and chloride-dependent glycine transporter 1 isoform X2 [Lingula anatina]|eukprot:XP_013384850.1 sodium- and chloride-dependent glycine transporter 1 isoform X2 [Lingula anatina]